MRLLELQRELQRDLLGEASTIADAIVDAPPLPVQARLGIYRHAYRARLFEALDEQYPILHWLLGDETFESLGRLFVETHPSEHRSIRWYGRELADFTGATAPFADQPILAEIARFEWTLSEVFDAADACVVDRAALQAIDPERWATLRFGFHPSLRRLSLAWNTVAVWQAGSAEQDSPVPERSPEPRAMAVVAPGFQEPLPLAGCDRAPSAGCGDRGRHFHRHLRSAGRAVARRGGPAARRHPGGPDGWTAASSRRSRRRGGAPAAPLTSKQGSHHSRSPGAPIISLRNNGIGGPPYDRNLS